MICDAFFFYKFCQNSTLILHISVTVAQRVVRLPGRREVMGSNPCWCLIFFVSQPVGRGLEPLLRHTFFAISVRGNHPSAQRASCFQLCPVCRIPVRENRQLKKKINETNNVGMMQSIKRAFDLPLFL